MQVEAAIFNHLQQKKKRILCVKFYIWKFVDYKVCLQTKDRIH